ncbi:MAG: hypothetical protein RLZZ200_2379 [Pseudomonadota bacterium]
MNTSIPDSVAPAGSPALPLSLVTASGFEPWLGGQSSQVAGWLRAQAFKPERQSLQCWPSETGSCGGAVAGLDGTDADLWLAASLAARLPPGIWALTEALAPAQATQFLLGWLLGGYRFDRYRKPPDRPAPRLVLPANADLAYAAAAARAVAFARDLINTPANDLGPDELESQARDLAARWAGSIDVTRGDSLSRGFPLIEAVGRGSPREPRLLDLRFPRPGAPRITLVGKGVCFDSGGLDIKPPSGMLLMKKDMGGAACALGLAQLLRELDAPIDLRVLVPAVENSVDGKAFRPGDVLRSRKGLTVEIGNTDAEGRLVLADALALAAEEAPDLIVDLATLTGAARVALGPDLPPVFSGDPLFVADLVSQGTTVGDPLWPMPLWAGYDDDLGSRIADVNNAGSSGLGGAITAALFLKRFVSNPERWIHIDLYGWNPKDRPGRPLGAEAHALRAVYGLIRQRFG